MAEKKRIDLYKTTLSVRKSKEPTMVGTVVLTNKNWVRLMNLANEYGLSQKKEVSESDILNMVINTYYNKILKRVKSQ
jgi:hypothetical protein